MYVGSERWKTMTIDVEGSRYEVKVSYTPKGYRVEVNGRLVEAKVKKLDGGEKLIVKVGGREFKIDLVEGRLIVNGRPILARILAMVRSRIHSISLTKHLPSLAHAKAKLTRKGHVRAPMSGKVVDVRVRVGDTVRKGDVLLVLESMKMLNQVLSPIDGVVKSVNVSTGSPVRKNELLVVIEPGRVC